MLVSYKWLQEYFEDTLPSPEELADSLSLKSFEIEGVEKVETILGDDYIIDVDVLPNRSHDCLSHNGVAKEISMITGLELKSFSTPENKSDFETKFEIDAQSEDCRRYIACEIKDIRIAESPDELKAKMQSLGQKSINNLVDITNIVMFEVGQPLHAFDTNKIDGQKIIIRYANDGEEITTLDNKEVKLDEKTLLIADENKPLAIAGIKGGKKAEVNLETKNIILESANFHPTSVRRTSRRIGIMTDSSKRFENEVSPELADIAVNRVIELIMQYASTEKTSVSNKVEHYPRKWRPYRTGVSVKEVNSLLGVNFSEKEVSGAFEKLNFKYEIINPRERIVEEAQSLLDRPYKYGASVFFDSPKTFDCSSLISYVYSIAGYSIPRMAVDQFVFSERIDEQDLLPGDLVFANTGILDKKIDYESIEYLPGVKVSHGLDHVGIYIGDGKVIHATKSNNSGVIEEILTQSESFKNIVGYGRIIGINDTESESRFALEVPIERLDIKNGPDLIEEVGRVIGYERIIDEPVSEKVSAGEFKAKINPTYQLTILLKNILTDIGFSEIITYSFIDQGSLEPLKPIAEDKAFIRESLLHGMKSAFEKNINNADLLALDHIKLFEIGRVFKKVDKNKNQEEQDQFPESDYAIEESLRLSLGVKNKQGIKQPAPEQLLLEAIEKINQELSINLQDNFGVKINQQTESIEINLDKILELKSNFFDGYPELPKINLDSKYKAFSQYPFMLRDIAVWVPSQVDKSEIIELITGVAGELLVNHKLFDVYEKDDKISYAHRLVFQSDTKTLTDGEANEIMDKVTNKMNEKGWEVR